MKCLSIFTTVIFLSLHCFSQKNNINEVAISAPLVWNQTTIFNVFAGARASEKTGGAISNGININYTKSIYKGFYLKAGIGYFKQKFGIVRGFKFEETVTLTGLGYSTKYYQYHNLQYLFGIGYNKQITQKYTAKLSATYNYLNSFKQEFKITGPSVFLGNRNPQIRKENYFFGSFVNLQAGVSKKLYKNLGVGVDIVLPVYTKWRKDEIFRENENEFYSSNFSIGTSINLIYSFNKK